MINPKFPVKFITPLMKENGFTLSGKCFYLIKNDVAYCIEFESPTDFVYVWFYIIPLYMPCEHRFLTFGNRFSSVPKFNLQPLDRNFSEQEAALWCENLTTCITKYVFPFFESMSTPEKILKFLKFPTPTKRAYFRCPDLFKLQLQTFSALFLGKNKQAKTALRKYTAAIKKCTFLQPAILEKYLQEAIHIEKLCSCDPAETKSFFQKNIQSTLQNCFQHKRKSDQSSDDSSIDK